jgi:hypothetical protein
MKKLPIETPPGFGVRQSSGAFPGTGRTQSGRGLPQSKTLSRQTSSHCHHDWLNFSHEI